MARSENQGRKDEPILLVRPAIKSLGLDYLHVSLIILIVILVALAFALSMFRPGPIVSNCQYGLTVNNTCITPDHTPAEALNASEQVLASYASTNSILSLLAYYSLPNQSTVSYLSNQSEWLVSIPYKDPTVNYTRFHFNILLYDSNLSIVHTFVQAPQPASITRNRVTRYGAVSIYGKTSCTYTPNTPVPVYGFIDPYAPGAIRALEAGINVSNRIPLANVSYKFIFTGYSLALYSTYGINATQQNGADLWCASLQPSRFRAYLANYSLLFNGYPIAASNLYQIAQGSGLNISKFNSCITAAPQKLNAQAEFAQYYDVAVTPTYVVNCQYQTIPETLGAVINSTLQQIKG